MYTPQSATPQEAQHISRRKDDLGILAPHCTPNEVGEQRAQLRRVDRIVVRRYRTVKIKAGPQIVTAADPLPDDLREAIAKIGGQLEH